MIHSCGTIFLCMEPSEAVAVNPGYYEQRLDGALAGRQARACLTRSSFVPRILPAAMSSTHTTDQVASSDVRTFTVMRLRKSASPGTTTGAGFLSACSARLYHSTTNIAPEVTLQTASSLARNQQAHPVRWSMVLCQEAIGGLISTSTLGRMAGF